MHSESDLLPISALQHLLFCERQCALIHLEGLWAENRLTIEGQQLHSKVHDGPSESRSGVRIVRGLPLRSLQLGLVGIADVVEFHTMGCAAPSHKSATNFRDLSQPNPHGQPFPVEYKRGKPKRDDSDRVQLCAQALCLEEMLSTEVPSGALFYGRMRRRLDVMFDEPLRHRTKEATAHLHNLIDDRVTPVVNRTRKCERCSMLNLCLPGATAPRRSAARYLARSLQQLADAPPPSDESP